MKENICTAAGVIGGFFAALLGGWDSALARNAPSGRCSYCEKGTQADDVHTEILS